MRGEGSITIWIGKLLDGDEQAATEIWRRYFQPLAAIAKKRRGDLRNSSEDEDDIVMSALDSFFRRARDGQFTELKDRDNLWSLLVTITSRKALNQRQRVLAKKRGGETQPLPLESVGNTVDAVRTQASPLTIVELNDWVRHLFSRLQDDGLANVADLKLQGYTNQEIAKSINRSERTVENRLRLIRKIWSEEIANS